MADRKKRRGRRAHLRDYVPDGKGGYTYRGQLLYFPGDAAAYRGYIRFLIAMAALILALTVVAECLPSVPVSRFPLTAVFWLGALVTGGLSAYYVWKTAWGRDPLKEHVYRTSTARIPVFYLIHACFCGALAAEEGIYLIVCGLSQTPGLDLARPVMAAAGCAASLICHLRVKRVKWSSTEDK